MSVFRRVEPDRAGPQALGILIPPGERTLVIVRPRSLAWDLLPAHWSGEPAAAPEFCAFGRDEAARVARGLHEALEQAVQRGENPVETLGSPSGRSFQIWVRAAGCFWIACRRAMGQVYQPILFASQEEACQAGDELARIVWPQAGAERELYFNTQKFAT